MSVEDIQGDEDDHSIKIKTSTWRQLNKRKHGPGDSFDDVINRLLAERDADE